MRRVILGWMRSLAQHHYYFLLIFCLCIFHIFKLAFRILKDLVSIQVAEESAPQASSSDRSALDLFQQVSILTQEFWLRLFSRFVPWIATATRSILNTVDFCF